MKLEKVAQKIIAKLNKFQYTFYERNEFSMMQKIRRQSLICFNAYASYKFLTSSLYWILFNTILLKWNFLSRITKIFYLILILNAKFPYGLIWLISNFIVYGFFYLVFIQEKYKYILINWNIVTENITNKIKKNVI